MNEHQALRTSEEEQAVPASGFGAGHTHLVTLLDEIIDGASSDNVSTSNLLRKVRTAASRLEAPDVLEWVKNELDGYPNTDGLPAYRVLRPMVNGMWHSYNRRMSLPVEAGRIPNDAADVLFVIHMTQAIKELEQLESLDSDPTSPWEGTQVVLYNRWVSQGLAAGIEGAALFSADRIITRGAIGGLIDTVRNKALDLALDLQKVNPEAGSQGGPTVADAPVGQTVMNFTQNVYGPGATVAQGQVVNQTTVIQGDLASLFAAAAEVGLRDPAAVAAMTEAVITPGPDRKRRVKAFLDSVRTGAWTLALGITAEVAAARLEPLIHAYLGW